MKREEVRGKEGRRKGAEFSIFWSSGLGLMQLKPGSRSFLSHMMAGAQTPVLPSAWTVGRELNPKWSSWDTGCFPSWDAVVS